MLSSLELFDEEHNIIVFWVAWLLIHCLISLVYNLSRCNVLLSVVQCFTLFLRFIICTRSRLNFIIVKYFDKRDLKANIISPAVPPQPLQAETRDLHPHRVQLAPAKLMNSYYKVKITLTVGVSLWSIIILVE